MSSIALALIARNFCLEVGASVRSPVWRMVSGRANSNSLRGLSSDAA